MADNPVTYPRYITKLHNRYLNCKRKGMYRLSSVEFYLSFAGIVMSFIFLFKQINSQGEQIMSLLKMIGSLQTVVTQLQQEIHAIERKEEI